MKITFDEKTAAKIKALGDVDLVFDFDHTLSEVNTEVDACAGRISRYRIVAVEKGNVPEEFDASIDSEFGPIYYKGYGSYFFQDEMSTKINTSYNLIELRSTAELLSPNLLIVDFRGKQKAS
ncbi:iron-sulfur cluster biosynthesis family protein [Lactococcus cremoris]|uniref:iron-sulfur cluster biosynthesis family protein n=1 Tax=Lactococcus lactis subsp. cremoris TaxID=1359 RepID=UPI0024A769B7|nr:iron-sulfur cluster biosynthesis family protein [Lactococcus cremoris]